MKNKFNLKSLVMGAIVGGMLTTGVAYATSQLNSIDVSFNPVSFVYNGEPLELGEGQQSFIYEGTTYVPLRWLSESLGKTVEWDEMSRTITIHDQVKEEIADPGEEISEEEQEAVNQAEEEQEAVELTDVELALDKEVYHPDDVIHFEIVNNGTGTISFGRPFGLEIWQNEAWVELQLELMFTMEMLYLDEGETFTQSIDLSQLELEIGKYKLTKHVFDEENQQPRMLSGTFEIKFGIMEQG